MNKQAKDVAFGQSFNSNGRILWRVKPLNCHLAPSRANLPGAYIQEGHVVAVDDEMNLYAIHEDNTVVVGADVFKATPGSRAELIAACEQLLHVCEGEDHDESFDWVREVIARAKTNGAELIGFVREMQSYLAMKLEGWKREYFADHAIVMTAEKYKAEADRLLAAARAI